jgi:hypothetical protein
VLEEVHKYLLPLICQHHFCKISSPQYVLYCVVTLLTHNFTKLSLHASISIFSDYCISVLKSRTKMAAFLKLYQVINENYPSYQFIFPYAK